MQQQQYLLGFYKFKKDLNMIPYWWSKILYNDIITKTVGGWDPWNQESVKYWLTDNSLARAYEMATLVIKESQTYTGNVIPEIILELCIFESCIDSKWLGIPAVPYHVLCLQSVLPIVVRNFTWVRTQNHGCLCLRLVGIQFWRRISR